MFYLDPGDKTKTNPYLVSFNSRYFDGYTNQNLMDPEPKKEEIDSVCTKSTTLKCSNCKRRTEIGILSCWGGCFGFRDMYSFFFWRSKNERYLV